METLEVKPDASATAVVITQGEEDGARGEDYDIGQFGYKSELEVRYDAQQAASVSSAHQSLEAFRPVVHDWILVYHYGDVGRASYVGK